MLELGSSRPWQDAMEVMTGIRSMSALPLVEYFTPLINWLKEQNKQENIGWSSACPTSIPSPTGTGSRTLATSTFVTFFTLLLAVLFY